MTSRSPCLAAALPFVAARTAATLVAALVAADFVAATGLRRRGLASRSLLHSLRLYFLRRRGRFAGHRPRGRLRCHGLGRRLLHCRVPARRRLGRRRPGRPPIFPATFRAVTRVFAAAIPALVPAVGAAAIPDDGRLAICGAAASALRHLSWLIVGSSARAVVIPGTVLGPPRPGAASPADVHRPPCRSRAWPLPARSPWPQRLHTGHFGPGPSSPAAFVAAAFGPAAFDPAGRRPSRLWSGLRGGEWSESRPPAAARSPTPPRSGCVPRNPPRLPPAARPPRPCGAPSPGRRPYSKWPPQQERPYVRGIPSGSGTAARGGVPERFVAFVGLVGAFLAAAMWVFLLANDCGHVSARRLRDPAWTLEAGEPG